MDTVSIFWFRRDLRLEDNAGLWKALKSGYSVLPIFVFDRNILDRLEERGDARVSFLYDRITVLSHELQSLGSSLKVFYGTPMEAMRALSSSYDVRGVYLNRDYDPYASARDSEVFEFWKAKDVPVVGAKDHVIFEKDEVVKADGTSYLVFSPYAKMWRRQLDAYQYKSYPNKKYLDRFYQCDAFEIPSLVAMNFERTGIEIPSAAIDTDIIKRYDETRNYPAQKKGTTRLGLHLRFGTISIRALLRHGLKQIGRAHV